MKRTLLGTGSVVLLLVGTLFWGPVSDFVYNAAYAPRRDRLAVVVTDVPEDREKHLTYNVPSGSVSGGTYGLSWSSWHSRENGPYYYRFENLGRETVYARSRLFTKLVGSTRLQLASKQVIYLRLMDYGPSTWLTEPVNVSAYDSTLASSGTGTSLTLVMPYSFE